MELIEITQYDQYYNIAPSAGGGPPPTASQAEHGPPPPVAEDPSKDVHITPGNPIPNEGMYTEEKIEYRDEAGNLLDAEQVSALEGQVSFSTRYETRTRLVDENGREIYNEIIGEDAGSQAGTSADGPDPDTANPKGEEDASSVPPKVGIKEDVRKEKERVEQVKHTAEPESEVGKETGKDEL